MKQALQATVLPVPIRGRLPLTGLSALCILIAFLLIAGCTQQATPPIEKPQPPAVLIEYARTGGIAGVGEYMVVFNDGWMVYNSTLRGSGGATLSAGDMELLRSLIRDADFASLREEYPAPVPGADYFTYTIVVGNRTIRTETTGVPPALLPVITTLDGILAGRMIPA